TYVTFHESDRPHVRRIRGPQGRDRAALAGELITEDGDVDGVAPGVVAVEVEGLVALEELVVRGGHVRGIESHLDPAWSVAVSAVLHVVVADDVPATGGPHH